MTQDEIDQYHEIFMLTVDNGHSNMKPTQVLTPEQILTWTAAELEVFKKLILTVILTENADLANFSTMTDTKLDESANANAESTSNLTMMGGSRPGCVTAGLCIMYVGKIRELSA